MKYGTGAIESKYDIRDYWYKPLDRGGFDWEDGFDVEKELGFKFRLKDQNGSGSCGGQAWSYYGEVLGKVAQEHYEPSSARWIYSHTHVPPGGGSRGRDNCAFCIDKGWVDERFASSYDNGKPPKEDFMRQTPELSNEAIADGEVQKALSYMQIPVNIEMFAQAIRDNYGMVLVLNGQDNGTWRSKFPEPPTEKEWGHFLFCCGAEMIDGKKYIKVINSWGDDTGEKGYQWLSEDWFKNKKLGIREGWTMAWDYRPAKRKLAMKQMIKLLETIVKLLTLKLKTKK